MLIHYINEEVRTTLELRSLKDASLVNEVELTAGSMSEFSCSGNIDRNTLEFFVKIIDYENPGSIYRCLVNKKLNCTVRISPVRFHHTWTVDLKISIAY